MPMTYAQSKQPQSPERTQAAAPQAVPTPAAGPGYAQPRCAVTPGEEQGGIIDWFRARFSRRPQEEAEVPAEVHPPAPPGPQQWVADSYGGVDLSQVTEQPLADSPLFPLVRPYDQEGPAQSPVFETHSFMPRESIDEIGADHLHSFIGLRFTQMDPKTNRVHRKRIKVGFGGDGAPFSAHGVMMYDTNTQADMSSETPISRTQLETAFALIPEKTREPYNVLTHNCNHFTQEMAQRMGATLPAQLHDTVLGPAGAYKNLANAAEYGEQDRTRFFQGGGDLVGQMSQRNQDGLLKNFWDTAKTAAWRDGLPFLLYPSLSQSAKRVQDAARAVSSAAERGAIQRPDGPQNFAARADTLVQAAESLVGLHMWKGHPRVSIAAKKVIAVTNRLRAEYVPKSRSVAQYSAEEIDALLTPETLAEQSAPAQLNQRLRIYNRLPEEEQKKQAKPTLQVNNNMLFASYEQKFEGAGEIFLDAMGLPAQALVERYKPEGEGSGLEECGRLLAELAAVLRGEAGGLNACLYAFAKNRTLLTSPQLGALAANGILNHLSVAAEKGHNSLVNILFQLADDGRSIAGTRNIDSLEMDKNQSSRTQVQEFVRKDDADADQQQQRQALLTQMNAIEGLLAQRCELLLAPEEQQPQPEEAVEAKEENTP